MAFWGEQTRIPIMPQSFSLNGSVGTFHKENIRTSAVRKRHAARKLRPTIWSLKHRHEELTNKAEGGKRARGGLSQWCTEGRNRGGLQSEPSMCEQANAQMKKGVKLRRRADGLLKSKEKASPAARERKTADTQMFASAAFYWLGLCGGLPQNAGYHGV